MQTLATRATARTQSPQRRTFEPSIRTVERGANRPDRDVTTVGIDPTRLARALGWFSLSLGIAEVLAPRFVARLAGVRHVHPGLVRLCGMREIASGMMIFVAPIVLFTVLVRKHLLKGVTFGTIKQ